MINYSLGWDDSLVEQNFIHVTTYKEDKQLHGGGKGNNYRYWGTES